MVRRNIKRERGRASCTQKVFFSKGRSHQRRLRTGPRRHTRCEEEGGYYAGLGRVQRRRQTRLERK